MRRLDFEERSPFSLYILYCPRGGDGFAFRFVKTKFPFRLMIFDLLHVTSSFGIYCTDLVLITLWTGQCLRWSSTLVLCFMSQYQSYLSPLSISDGSGVSATETVPNRDAALTSKSYQALLYRTLH
jgi:hypothetical protein